jgi:hypothetical protein
MWSPAESLLLMKSKRERDKRGVFQGCKLIFEEKDKIVNSTSINSTSQKSLSNTTKKGSK